MDDLCPLIFLAIVPATVPNFRNRSHLKQIVPEDGKDVSDTALCTLVPHHYRGVAAVRTNDRVSLPMAAGTYGRQRDENRGCDVSISYHASCESGEYVQCAP